MFPVLCMGSRVVLFLCLRRRKDKEGNTNFLIINTRPNDSLNIKTLKSELIFAATIIRIRRAALEFWTREWLVCG